MEGRRVGPARAVSTSMGIQNHWEGGGEITGTATGTGDGVWMIFGQEEASP